MRAERVLKGSKLLPAPARISSELMESSGELMMCAEEGKPMGALG